MGQFGRRGLDLPSIDRGVETLGRRPEAELGPSARKWGPASRKWADSSTRVRTSSRDQPLREDRRSSHQPAIEVGSLSETLSTPVGDEFQPPQYRTGFVGVRQEAVRRAATGEATSKKAGTCTGRVHAPSAARAGGSGNTCGDNSVGRRSGDYERPSCYPNTRHSRSSPRTYSSQNTRSFAY
ncbi:hypothetical protein HPB47_007658 [Ixodes persulcatus]|uniref:Uncharacterized protein n=1 Tax=Ixodes persulcatus TaxID=34615 RepID=A0AC60P6X0_IXOPE|nr:hypothetical protein HPB47_007658 [Ixodes persulcatus]